MHRSRLDGREGRNQARPVRFDNEIVQAASQQLQVVFETCGDEASQLTTLLDMERERDAGG